MTYTQAWHEMQRDAAPDVVELSSEMGVVKHGRRCTTCGETILPGMRYRRNVYLVDGQIVTDQTCVWIGPDDECPLRTPGRLGERE